MSSKRPCTSIAEDREKQKKDHNHKKQRQFVEEEKRRNNRDVEKAIREAQEKITKEEAKKIKKMKDIAERTNSKSGHVNIGDWEYVLDNFAPI